MKKSYILLALVISACVPPSANVPVVSESEIRHEREKEGADIASSGLESMKKQQLERLKLEERLVKISVSIAPAAANICLGLKKESASNTCVYSYSIDKPGSSLNAHADGKEIVIAPAMIRFAKSDAELAFILSHETAHNIMGHAGGQSANALMGAFVGSLLDGISGSQHVNTRGELGKAGQQIGILTYSPAYEAEADYIGLYILARAGYKIDDVPEFWHRLALHTPASVYTDTTHPTTPERYIAMEKTIREIHWKKKHHQPLLPELKP